MAREKMWWAQCLWESEGGNGGEAENGWPAYGGGPLIGDRR